MSKIGVIGPRDSILGFRAAGVDVFPVNDAAQAAHTINRLAKQGYAVLFISEQTAAQIPQTFERYKGQAYPALIPIPGASGSGGLGMALVRKNIEKAIGSDILSNNQG